MARSYKSALPTWSTYTPHISPMGIQGAINQENWWGDKPRASLWSTGGHRTHDATVVASMVRGTGTAAYAAQMPHHQPITNALMQGVTAGRGRLDERRRWMDRTREAMEHHAPERMTEEGEHEPSTPLNVRAERTEAETGPGRRSPPTVDPTDVVTHKGAQDTVSTVAAATVASKRAGSDASKDVADRLDPTAPAFVVKDRRKR